MSAGVVGDFEFHTLSDDGVRLWVTNRLIVEHWTDRGTTENGGTIALVAGRPCDLRLQYYENGGAGHETLVVLPDCAWRFVAQLKTPFIRVRISLGTESELRPLTVNMSCSIH